ncbi:unnamed protein product [Brassica rapa]|uniref:Uncharacterized protein n=1 Tax=Brassica campestris TaxID=3711 RepID=A0A8D9DLU4_BRACM|nr:unnamed protein product [Brassica rapa]
MDQRADMCTDGQPITSYVPRGPKSPEQSTGRASVLSPRTNMLICVLMDSHGRPVHGCPVCADGHTQTHTDSHGRPVCADGHTRTQPTWAKITRTVHGKGQRAQSKDQRADMCTDGEPHTSCVVCWRTPTDVMCVLNRQPTWAKITQTVHLKGQRAESKDQRADICTDGQPRTSCVC